MNKSLYSLMLMDRVVEEIDALARREGTNRSNLVNRILADYVKLTTPEQRIGSIFEMVERALTGGELVPFVEPNRETMSVKSSLDYRYRPTLRYEVQLYRIPHGSIGEFSVIYRTQSAELVTKLEHFFRLWKTLESIYLSRLGGAGEADYSLSDGRLTRSIVIRKDRDYSSEELAQALTEYVRMFDSLLKAELAGASPEEIEERYLGYLNRGIGRI